MAESPEGRSGVDKQCETFVLTQVLVLEEGIHTETNNRDDQLDATITVY